MCAAWSRPCEDDYRDCRDTVAAKEYLRGPITPLIVRRHAWWTLTAGGFATYGQGQTWRMGKGWTGTIDTPELAR